MRKLILYIACSLDGYIAKPNDNLDFLNSVHKEGEDYGYGEFIKTIDSVILGRRTYDWVIRQGFDFPYGDKECYIITRQRKEKEGNLIFYNGSLENLVEVLKKKEGKNIFCDGGAEIVNQLLELQLIDEMILSVVPVLIGSGIRLFKDDRPEQRAELVSVQGFDTGLVQMRYRFLK